MLLRYQFWRRYQRSASGSKPILPPMLSGSFPLFIYLPFHAHEVIILVVPALTGLQVLTS